MQQPPNRWLAQTGGTRGPAYARRFRELAASGADVHGEARLLDRRAREVAAGPARVLDAGCGTGRIALQLARLGHRVVGVDLDASMLAEAAADAAGDRAGGVDVRFVHGDLVDLPGLLGPADAAVDLVAAPGNVMVYLTPGTEPDVVAALAATLRPGGLLVAGFAHDRHVLRADYAGWCAAAGLSTVAAYSTWNADPDDGGGYAVHVHRR